MTSRTEENHDDLVEIAYKGPSGTFIAGDVTLEIWRPTEISRELWERLCRDFPDHNFDLVK